MLEQIRVYSRAIVAVLALGTFAAVGVRIAILQHQRDAARAEVARLQSVIKAYQAASDAARERVQAAVAKAEVTEKKHAALVGDLNSTLPKTPEEALAWAVKAGKQIDGATR